MAQQDTGLGWSAKDDWLVSLSGVIGTANEFGGPDYPGQPIPKGYTTAADIVLANFKICKVYDPRNSTYKNYELYAASVTDDILVAYRSDFPHSAIRLLFISMVQNATLTIAWKSLSDGTVGIDSTQRCYNYDAQTGLYWGYVSWSFPSSATYPETTYYDAAGFTSDSAAFTAVQRTSINITKDNPGYAVGCIAKWKTSANVVITTPVLISSKSEFTNMSPDNWNFAKYNTSRDGRRFYMSFFQSIDESITSILPVFDISGPEEPYADLDEVFNLICASYNANVIVTEPQDPYDNVPPTGDNMGDPDPDQEDDDIEGDDLPDVGFATAGFCRIYRPSFSQVSDLARYVWTDQSFLQTVINHLKQIIENPIDAIISLSIVPCTPSVLTDEEVKVMYVPTGVYMPPVQSQYVEVDCGTYELTEMYGSALDYNPYTSVQLYLPYIGTVQLDTDEVMGKTIRVGYRIDVVTGVCCAYVKANKDVLYQFSGHCSITQPLTSADFSGYLNAALAAGKLVASVAAAGAGAPAVAATIAGAPAPSISGTSSETRMTERNPKTGRQITTGTRRHESVTSNPGASFGEIAARGISNTVGSVMNSKTIIQHSGGFSGNSGFLAKVRRPYLIVTHPNLANPREYGKYNGRPSMQYRLLNDCKGFTQVQSIQLTGIDATNPELSEIATLLTSGVIL